MDYFKATMRAVAAYTYYDGDKEFKRKMRRLTRRNTRQKDKKNFKEMLDNLAKE